MKNSRRPAWTATGLLSIMFIASLIMEKRSQLPWSTQSVLMVISVIVFYVLLWFVTNANTDRLDE